MKHDHPKQGSFYRLPSRGRGLLRQEFYSIHSGPICDEEIDGVCPHGRWVNVTAQRLSTLLYRASPGVWRWWTNRRWFNPSRRFLLRMLPNMRG